MVRTRDGNGRMGKRMEQILYQRTSCSRRKAGYAARISLPVSTTMNKSHPFYDSLNQAQLELCEVLNYACQWNTRYIVAFDYYEDIVEERRTRLEQVWLEALTFNESMWSLEIDRILSPTFWDKLKRIIRRSK